MAKYPHPEHPFGVSPYFGSHTVPAARIASNCDAKFGVAGSAAFLDGHQHCLQLGLFPWRHGLLSYNDTQKLHLQLETKSTQRGACT